MLFVAICFYLLFLLLFLFWGLFCFCLFLGGCLFIFLNIFIYLFCWVFVVVVVVVGVVVVLFVFIACVGGCGGFYVLLDINRVCNSQTYTSLKKIIIIKNSNKPLKHRTTFASTCMSLCFEFLKPSDNVVFNI